MAADDLTGFGLSSAFLSFNVQKVEVMNKKSEALFRLSLAIPTTVLIKKSNVECVSYVWASSVFSEGDKDKDIEMGVQLLLDQFSACYREANAEKKEKPTFYLYTGSP